MKMVWKWGVCDEEVLSAAILHDVVEDTEIPISKIEKEFGARVAKIVGELTLYRVKNKEDYAKAKEEYIKSFENKSAEALVCKMADRICNTRDKLLSDKNALEYYEKAKPVVKTFWNKFCDISNKWGFITAQNINYERLQLEEEIGI